MTLVLHATTEDITTAVYICIMIHTERWEEELGAQKKGTKCPNLFCLVLQQIYVLLCCYRHHGPANRQISPSSPLPSSSPQKAGSAALAGAELDPTGSR